jgi:hypothetical protein
VKLKLFVSQLEDPYLQQNFKTIGDLFRGIPFLKGEFKFVEFEVRQSGTGQRVQHGLPFLPKDVIVTSVVGGSVVFNYTRFDAKFLDFDATVTSSPLVVRAFIGRYTEDTINV